LSLNWKWSLFFASLDSILNSGLEKDNWKKFNQILMQKLNEDSEVLDQMSDILQLFPEAQKTGFEQLKLMQSQAWIQLEQLPWLEDTLDRNDSADIETMMRRIMILADALVRMRFTKL
jgi:hypothetical protein